MLFAESRTRSRLLVLSLAVAGLALSMPAPVLAYSYSAAGAEPLIQVREKVLGDLTRGDYSAAAMNLEGAAFELNYLDKHFDLNLRSDIEAALANEDADAIDSLFNRAFAAEVRRRMRGAGENLDDYQRAKVLVVKSKLFFDLLGPALPPTDRSRAEKALRACLEAIGNPGIFGAGSRPADPKAFAENEKVLGAALDSLF